MPHVPRLQRLFPVLLVAGLLTGGCTGKYAEAPEDAAVSTLPEAGTPGRLEQLSAEAFLQHSRDEALVIDVRTPEEYAAGHLVGAANIDLQAADFRARVDPLARDRTYYLYCRSGNRSQRAAEIMHEMDFQSLYNIGGYTALARAGAETTP